MTDSTCTVLVVEDEHGLADLYESVLEPSNNVITTDSGREALERIDDSIDVVLLDRKMPGLSGEEVLERIRDDGYDIPVAMLTAVVPDWDIIEMGFDDYLLKPVDDAELRRAIERLRALGAIDDEIREYVTQSVKQAALEAQKSPSDLDANEAFERLSRKIAEAGGRLGDVTADLSEDETELIIETVTHTLETTPTDDDLGA